MNLLRCGRWQDHRDDFTAASMVYADPPYGTGRHFRGYTDTSALPEWIAEITDLLDTCRQTMTRGVVWVHLDDARAHHARVAGENLLGPKAHVGTIAWQRNNSGRGTGASLVRQTDYITGWRIGDFTVRKVPKGDYSAGLYGHRDGDVVPWRRDTLAAQGTQGGNCHYGITNPLTGQVHWPGDGYHWRWSYQRALQALDGWGTWVVRHTPEGIVLVPSDTSNARKVQEDGPWPVIFFGTEGQGKPQRKTYHTPDAMPGNFWTSADTGTTSDALRQVRADLGFRGFDTPKPVGLLTKLIEISTDPGDMVLDPFAGSGTTGVAAGLSGRTFTLIESNSDTVTNVIRPRLTVHNISV